MTKEISNPEDGSTEKEDEAIEIIDTSSMKEMSLKDVANVLDITIKHDDANKVITLLCMLSAYTASAQINVSYNAPSSNGKTFITTEVAKFFPNEDKIELSGASPTALFHGEGVWDKKLNAKIVSFERRILIVYEQPNPSLQAKIRAVLSHDQWEIHHRITNKDKKGALRAEHIILRGWPASVFCSAGMQLDEQEATRAILLSPEVNSQKLHDGVHMQALRSADAERFEKELESNPERIALKLRILAIRQAHVGEIIIPHYDYIEKRFKASVGVLKARHMRDIKHLMQLIKSIALLNVWFRTRPDGTVQASQSDIDQAFELWDSFSESQDLNIPPAVMTFYKNYILPAYNEKKSKGSYQERKDVENGLVGLTQQELNNYYLKIEHTPINDDQLRKQILPQLEASGLVSRAQPEIGDKRSIHIFPKFLTEEEQNNTGEPGGYDDSYEKDLYEAWEKFENGEMI